jgi:hypothetical protein
VVCLTVELSNIVVGGLRSIKLTNIKEEAWRLWHLVKDIDAQSHHAKDYGEKVCPLS